MATIRVRPPALDLATIVPGATVMAGVAVALSLALLVERRPQPVRRSDGGILPCPASARHDLLSASALQCWFDAPNGRWRTLSRVSAHGALVVEVEATTTADAEEIARRFVDDRGGHFSEVLIYAQGEWAVAPFSIRRIRWTQPTGFENAEFLSPAP